MRIIAGKYRGRKIKSPTSLATRPTSDRLRETLFNILAPRIEGARFLDLCAGTGAVGIEAVSRGAAHVTFVDQSQKMSALIKENCDALKIDSDETDLVTADASDFLRQYASKSNYPFDIIFFDPPYAMDYDVLRYVEREALLANDGLVIVEHYKKKELAEELNRLRLFRQVKQGDSVLSFYRPCQNRLR
jgi:16S rRNA (guanine(966)-N(2))-methyltransferase RsmD